MNYNLKNKYEQKQIQMRILDDKIREADNNLRELEMQKK